MRTYTALYRTRAEAEAVQARLTQLGIIDRDHEVHDRPDSFDRVPMEGGDRETFRESVRRGGFLLTVNVDEERADEALRVIEGSSPIDLDAHERELRGAGFVGAARETPEGETRIPVVEEQLAVGKRDTVRGGARIRSYVREVPVEEQVRLREEHVHVERRPVGEVLRGDPGDLLRDREIEVTEHAEEAVVGKRAVVTEEVVVGKDVRERTETVDDTVRRTEVEVEELRGRDRR